MAEEEQKNKRITPLERALSQQFQVLGNHFGNLGNEIIHSPSKYFVRMACLWSKMSMFKMHTVSFEFFCSLSAYEFAKS